MTHQIISYKLNADGTVPSYIKDGGYYLNEDAATGARILLGVTYADADISDAVTVFHTVDELEAYISTYLENKKYSTDESLSAFSITNAAQKLFSKTLTE